MGEAIVMRRISHTIVLMICAVVAARAGPALAQPLTSEVRAPEYRLQPGDILEIWSAREPQLNREIVVRPDGRVSLPLAGHLEAGGLTLGEFEGVIAEAVAPYFTLELDLVAILSPPEERDLPVIYVAGDVTTPGAYRYRPGMTILHAVSVAGGYLRPEAGADGDVVIETQRDLTVLRRRAVDLAAQEARVLAELTGVDELDRSATEADPALADVLDREQVLMDLRRRRFNEDVDAGERRIRQASRDATTLVAQLAAFDEQIARMTQEHARVRSLVDRGLAVETRALDLQLLLADFARTQLELSAGLSRANTAVLQSEAEIAAIRTRRSLELSSELHEVQQLRAESAINIAASERSLSRMGASSAARVSNLERPVGFSIMRSADGAMQRLPADELTEIRADDLVSVLRFADPAMN